MVNKNSIKLFGDDKIRAIWDNEQEKWHSCISPWQYNHVIQRS